MPSQSDARPATSREVPNSQENIVSTLLKEVGSSLVKVRDLRKGNIRETDTVILLIGPVGSGKTSFVNTAAGANARVGNGLESCTKRINVVRVPVPNKGADIVLVDTPGFDDVYRSDKQTLDLISVWVKKARSGNVPLDGILYFHPISENRMDNVTLKNLTLFEEFCGSQWFERVVMMTTMWDRLKDKTMGERREEELRSTFWRPMIDCGSTIVRYESNRESAWHILRPFLDTPRHPLQERAGSILANKLKETYQQLRKQIAGVPRKFLSNIQRWKPC